MAKDVIIIPESGSLIFSGSTSPLSSSFVSNNSGSLTLYLEKTGNQSFAIEGSGSTLFSINGSIGQLFSVNDISGIPILEVFSDDTVKMGTFNNEAIVVSGSHATIKHLDVSSSLTASSVKVGDNSNYLQVSSTGDLTLNGTADYLVGANRYAFRFIGDEDYGLYFNASGGQYEFRNFDATNIFSINAGNGNTNIAGTLSIPGFNDVSASLAAAVAGGDNLGNHTATQNLNMGGFAITSVGNVDGVDVSTLNSTVSTNTSNISTNTSDISSIASFTSSLDPDIITLSLPSSTTISTFGASLIDDANSSIARSTLGLGSIATATADDYVSINGDTLGGDLDLNTYNIINIDELRATTVSGSTFVSDGATVVSTPDTQTVKIGQSAGGGGPMKTSIVSNNIQYGLFSNTGIELTGSVGISSTLSIPGYPDVSASLASLDSTNYVLSINSELPDAEGDISLSIPTNNNQLTNGAGYTTNTGTVTSVGGTGTVSGLSLSGTVTTSGNLTLGGTINLVAGDIPTITSAKISDVDAFSQSGTYANLRAQGTTAGDVGLGNVTNESKATMFSSPTFTGTVAIPGFNDVSASLAAAVAGGDNLGNHTATQDLNMGGNAITNALSITASGLNYPDTDGLDRQVMKTDGNGNLSFGYAENVEISVKNVSGGSIPKGTPCYITASGTSGNVAGIIPSDASDISTMPAGVIAGETLADEAEGVGLVNGFIQGVDTSAFTSGDTVYVAVGGGYTNVKPTGSGVYIQKLGNVEKVDNINGSGVINGPGYYNDLPNWETGKVMVGTDTYPATSSLITLDENGSNLIINGTLSGSGGSQLNLDLYEFGYEITTSFPITGSGLIVSSSNLPANHYNMVKIGETELLDLNTSFTPNTFFIHNVDNFIVASGSEPVNVYGDGPGKLFEHTGDEFKIYTGDVNRITVANSSTNFTHPITTNQISTAATIASSPQYVAVWESLPSGTPAEVKYVTASTFTGGGGGSTTLGGLNDVTITSVTDGDLLRYNGTATEWQNTNLGLSLTPTLSIESEFYFPGSATITNYASYSAPSIFAEVKLDGNVLVPNENISRDGSGNLTWADPSGSLNTGSRVLEVQVQDFGDLASEITTGSYTVSEASFRYVRFETTTASDHTYVREFRVYTDGGQSGTAYPPDMTSDTAPSPYVASSSGAYTSTYAAFKAFDNNPTSTGWWNLAQSPYSGDWVQIDFGSAITFKSIQLIINPSYNGFSVGTIYASNSGSFTGEEITLATFDNSLNTINIG